MLMSSYCIAGIGHDHNPCVRAGLLRLGGTYDDSNGYQPPWQDGVSVEV